MNIKIVKDSISRENLRKLAEETYGDMVKAVVDVDQGIMAVGGGMHSDAEQVLLRDGSKQASLWGINIFPNKEGDEMIKYESLINIRPRDSNRSMEIQNPEMRKKIKEIVTKLTT